MYIVAAGLCFFSYPVGDAFFYEGGAPKLEWCPGWQETGKKARKVAPLCIFWFI